MSGSRRGSQEKSPKGNRDSFVMNFEEEDHDEHEGGKRHEHRGRHARRETQHVDIVRGRGLVGRGAVAVELPRVRAPRRRAAAHEINEIASCVHGPASLPLSQMPPLCSAAGRIRPCVCSPNVPAS